MGTGGNDPTTTIPGAAGSGNVGLVLVLTLLGLLLAMVGLRVFYRSMRRNASPLSKTVGGGLCATSALSYAILLVQVDNIALAVLLLLVMLGFVGYMVPAVRVFVRSKTGELLHSARTPKQPPDRVSHT